MGRALYSPDRQRAREHRERLLSKRRNGGTYIELGTGSNPTVVYSEWTCPACGRTLKNTHATGKVVEHRRFVCHKSLHPDQTELGNLTYLVEGRDSE